MDKQIRNLDKDGFTLAVNELVKLINESKDPNVQADFLTEGGFGNLRYYQNKFQYYDVDSEQWVDAVATPDNILVLQMAPNSMRMIFGMFDASIGYYKLKWQEPADTIVDGQAICIIDTVTIRRKLGSVPEDVEDGELVTIVRRANFGNHVDNWYTDYGVKPNVGDTYYYKAFPMSTQGFYNVSVENQTGGLAARDYWIYGFRLYQGDSDPDSMITYIEDNEMFRPAHMNFATDSFDYGDWGDAEFIRNLKPCVLNYDGTVAYELDKNDYGKKIDGSESNVNSASINGNVMVGFPKVYWKITVIDENTCEVRFSNKKIDEDYHCWSHINNEGDEIDYCYIAAYNGSHAKSAQICSLSSYPPKTELTRQQEIEWAKNNNPSGINIWYTEVFADRMFVNLLLLLIGRSTDSQKTFGAGNNNSYVSINNTGVLQTGTMNAKGLFWGNQDNKSGVKVFGIENWWGNINRAIAGWVNDNGTQKIKLTYGTQDGSETQEYNLDGSGYIPIDGATPIGTNGGYISKMKISPYGIIPVVAGGSATTYYTDGLWFKNTQKNYAVVGGSSYSGLLCGALSSALNVAPSGAGWSVGASLSCKPLA